MSEQNRVHIVSELNVYTGIKNKIFTNLEEANDYYDHRLQKTNSDKTVTIYLEEDVELTA